jgi:hypothetical protein
MRDVINRLALIEARQTFPNLRWVELANDEIVILEDDKSIQTVIDVMRKLATKTGEGRQLAKLLFNKDPEDITDQEVYNKVISGGLPNARPYMPGVAQASASAGGADKVRDQIGQPFAKTVAANMIPKSKVRIPGVGNVDVDVSGDDLGHVQDAYDTLRKQFPKAASQVSDGDYVGALRTAYQRMAND